MEAHTKRYIVAGVFGLLTVALTTTIVGWIFTLPVAVYYWRRGKLAETGVPLEEWEWYWSPEKPAFMTDHTAYPWVPDDEASAPWYKRSFGYWLKRWRGDDSENA